MTVLHSFSRTEGLKRESLTLQLQLALATPCLSFFLPSAQFRGLALVADAAAVWGGQRENAQDRASGSS